MNNVLIIDPFQMKSYQPEPYGFRHADNELLFSLEISQFGLTVSDRRLIVMGKERLFSEKDAGTLLTEAKLEKFKMDN